MTLGVRRVFCLQVLFILSQYRVHNAPEEFFKLRICGISGVLSDKVGKDLFLPFRIEKGQTLLLFNLPDSHRQIATA